jgi:hypothetical protein
MLIGGWQAMMAPPSVDLECSYSPRLTSRCAQIGEAKLIAFCRSHLSYEAARWVSLGPGVSHACGRAAWHARRGLSEPPKGCSGCLALAGHFRGVDLPIFPSSYR